jgi:hypothetical protein
MSRIASSENFLKIGFDALFKAVLYIASIAEQDAPEIVSAKQLDRNFLKSTLGSLETLIADDSLELSAIPGDSYSRFTRIARSKNLPLWLQLNKKQSIEKLLEMFDVKYYSGIIGSPIFNPQNPRTVAKFGLWMIKDLPPEGNSSINYLLWGLALIGCGWSQIEKHHFCKLCYRRAWPGRMHCENHSQSNTDKATRSQIVLNRKIAIKVMELAAKSSSPLARTDTPEELQEYEMAALIDLLCPQNFGERDTSLHVFTLSMSPHVVAMLGGESIFNLSYDELFTKLRLSIDPYEWWDAVWPSKICAAEEWLRLESDVRKTTRGEGKRTQERIEAAIKLAKAGYSRTYIIESLQIQPATFRKWVSRYPDLRAHSPVMN